MPQLGTLRWGVRVAPSKQVGNTYPSDMLQLVYVYDCDACRETSTAVPIALWYAYSCCRSCWQGSQQDMLGRT